MLHSRANQKLVMLDDAELAAEMGVEVRSRETIREWPLSWTQKVEFADGRRYAYKSQLAPMVEPAFFAACASPLLPAHHALGSYEDCSTLLVEWLDAPSLADLGLGADEIRARGAEVVGRIAEIGSDLPVYLDVGTPQKWTAEARTTLDKLRTVMADRRFLNLAADLPDRLEVWAGSEPVLERIASDSRIVHRDLKLEHVFVTGDGYRVIDWAVPAIAPGLVDLVWLLKGSGIGSLGMVDAATHDIAHFLGLRWAVVAQHDFFPAHPNSMFEYWASESAAVLLRD